MKDSKVLFLLWTTECIWKCKKITVRGFYFFVVEYIWDIYTNDWYHLTLNAKQRNGVLEKRFVICISGSMMREIILFNYWISDTALVYP